LAIISYDKGAKELLPKPRESFILVIDGREYTTSIIDLGGGRRSIGRTFERGERIGRDELCSRHHLKEEDKVCIEPEIPLKRYNLSRASAAVSAQDPGEDEVPETIRRDALRQLMAEKGKFTGEEFFAKLKQLQLEYRKKKADK
ncbi:unnamed protein product, partial [marine sediment metagenome]